MKNKKLFGSNPRLEKMGGTKKCIDTPDGKRICLRSKYCDGKAQPLSNFGKNGKGGHVAVCRKCMNGIAKEKREMNKVFYF